MADRHDHPGARPGDLGARSLPRGLGQAAHARRDARSLRGRAPFPPGALQGHHAHASGAGLGRGRRTGPGQASAGPGADRATQHRERARVATMAARPPATSSDHAPPVPTRASRPEPRVPRPARPVQPETLADEDLSDSGCALVRSGKARQGYRLLQRAFDDDPSNITTILCMGEAHLALGRLDAASALVRRVLDRDPSNERALRIAARIDEARTKPSAESEEVPAKETAAPTPSAPVVSGGD